MEKVSLASVKIVSVSWDFIVNADVFKPIATKWNSLCITWLKQSMITLDIVALLCKILSSKRSMRTVVQVSCISEPLNSWLNKWKSLIHLHRDFSFIFLQKLQNEESVILAWYNNQLCATQCTFRFSESMGFAQRKDCYFCTGKRCIKWRDPMWQLQSKQKPSSSNVFQVWKANTETQVQRY